jgi:hypothetical protein
VVKPACSVSCRVLPGQQGAVLDLLLHHLVVPGGFVVRVQQHVRVQVDQAGDQGLAGQVDALGIGRGLDASGRADRFDAPVRHQHRPAALRGAVAGPDPLGRQQRRRLSDQGQCEQGQRCQLSHGFTSIKGDQQS